MSNCTLRNKLIRLAHQNPALRADLLPLLKQAAWEDGGAVKMNLIATFPNVEEGTEGRVFDLGYNGFSAMLFDVDSGNTVGGRVYPRDMKQKALEYAEKIAFGAASGSEAYLRLAHPLLKRASGEPLVVSAEALTAEGHGFPGVSVEIRNLPIEKADALVSYLDDRFQGTDCDHIGNPRAVTVVVRPENWERGPHDIFDYMGWSGLVPTVKIVIEKWLKKNATSAVANTRETKISPLLILKLQNAMLEYRDEQSSKLVGEVYKTLSESTGGDFNSDEKEALRRLQGAVANMGKWDAGLLRNNIFKAAHALGMKLPSFMF